MPQTFAKHASASPPTSASAATPTSDSRIGPAEVTPLTSARYTTHSLMKPFSGGRPTMATDPIRNAIQVSGIRRARPPRRSRSRVPVA